MSKAGGYYPPVGFHFLVKFQGMELDNDTRFQSVSGLSVEVETESFKEGGENRFEWRLPVRTKYTDLSLKRGLLVNSQVIGWFLAAFEQKVFQPIDILISLLNEKHEPVKSWLVFGAWPKKWTVSDFNAQENTIVVETLDLCYTHFKTL